MDPFTIAIGIASLATSIFGASASISGTQQASAAQQQQIMLEQRIQKQQEAQMELISRRQQVEQVRQANIARATNVSNATNQGAAASSGLAGGQAAATGQERYNLTGIQQNTKVGENIYGLTFGIDQARIQMAQAQAYAGLGSGLMALGGAGISNLTPMSNLFGSFSGMFGPGGLSMGIPGITTPNPILGR